MNALEIVSLIISLVMLASVIIGFPMAWQKIKDRSDENRRRNEELAKRCDTYDAFAEKFATLSNDIKWITKTLDERRKNGGTEHLRRDGKRDQPNP